MNSAHRRVPEHLKKYITEQNYDLYTARDHAAWRAIMRQSADFFLENAVPNYLLGLKKTAISLSRIPKISEMDKALNEFGWSAIPVRGFIPPSAFINLQSLRILPIAADMRTVEHLGYTPAPDIVHEAAGHAPLLADASYSLYLTKYAQLARRAIFSRHDVAIYEAIRKLSDLKENPDASQEQIASAEIELKEASASVNYTSEASKVARMYWWTVEYGLMGTLKYPKIYGAGLLSSVAESRYSLTDAVTKIPLSLAVTDMGYDITEPQPQLFVARDFDHLTEVLVDLEQNLAFYRGGTYALEQALKAGTITTMVFENGLAVSGHLSACLSNPYEQIEFLRYTGPVQLGYQDALLPGQGIDRHDVGFSSPLGRLEARQDCPFSQLDESALQRLNIVTGQRVTLTYSSGFVVEGDLTQIVRNQQKQILYMSFTKTRVTRGEEVYYQPEWGDFDLAVGETLVSAYGGPVAPEQYPELASDLGEALTQPGRSTPYSLQDQKIFSLYERIRNLRNSPESLPDAGTLENIYEEIGTVKADEWLLFLEFYEVLVLKQDPRHQQLRVKVKSHLNELARSSKEVGKLIKAGLSLSSLSDRDLETKISLS